MGVRSTEVDSYIAAAQPFAQPILTKLRALFHRASPKIEEKMKWNCPHFEYKGIIGGIAGFKQHATWGLRNAALLNDPQGALKSKSSSAMGAGHLTDAAQLPPDDVIVDLIQQAVELNDKGIKISQKGRNTKRPLPKMPPDLSAALKKNPKAAAAFKAFSPSHKREYILWITEAKQDATRQRRLLQAMQWIALGKPRDWKYMPKHKPVK